MLLKLMIILIKLIFLLRKYIYMLWKHIQVVQNNIKYSKKLILKCLKGIYGDGRIKKAFLVGI